MATVHVLEETSIAQHEYHRQGMGCVKIVFGFTVVSLLIFALFGYPNYHTSRAWLFWLITAGVLFANSLVIYLAVFVSRAVKNGQGKQ